MNTYSVMLLTADVSGAVQDSVEDAFLCYSILTDSTIIDQLQDVRIKEN